MSTTIRCVPLQDTTARRQAARVAASATMASTTGWLLAASATPLLLLALTWGRAVRPSDVLLAAALSIPLTIAASWCSARLQTRPLGGSWWIVHDPGRGTAVAAVGPPDSRGRVKLSSLAASPRRRGLGSQLITAIQRHHRDHSLHGWAWRWTATRLYRDQLGATTRPLPATLGLVHAVETHPLGS